MPYRDIISLFIEPMSNISRHILYAPGESLREEEYMVSFSPEERVGFVFIEGGTGIGIVEIS